MQDIAEAVGLTKAGLYHHVSSKDMLLFEIMNYGMDILDETVLAKVKDIADPREKLRKTIIGHIDLVVRARDMEITVILNENRSLKGALRKKINARKRAYIKYLEDLIARVQEQSGMPPKLSPHIAAFAVLGMINWLYQWYHAKGPLRKRKSPTPTWTSSSAACLGYVKVTWPMPSIAFQGERGSFSEEAAYKLLGRRITVRPCETFAAIFESVVRGRRSTAWRPSKILWQAQFTRITISCSRMTCTSSEK